MRKLLLPFSLLYWLGVAFRNLFFDNGVLKTTKVKVPIISVGNISAGGVGKTPVVEMLIERLKRKRHLAVVSRGYGRKSSGTVLVSDGKHQLVSVEKAGDEACQIANKYSDLIVIVDENRVRGAHKAVELGAELIVLDDGFQHRYLVRDLDVVILTTAEILNGDLLLPAGNRREPIASLERADVVMVSQCLNKREYERAARKVLKYKKPIVGLRATQKSLKRASSEKNIGFKKLIDKIVIAFSGIGSPVSFEALLVQTGAILKKHFVFHDHHWYTERDIETIVQARKQFDADFVITTEKDVVRLKERYVKFLEAEPIYVAEIRQEILAGEKRLNDSLKRILNSCALA